MERNSAAKLEVHAPHDRGRRCGTNPPQASHPPSHISPNLQGSPSRTSYLPATSQHQQQWLTHRATAVRIAPAIPRILLIRAVYVKARHVGYQRGKRNTNPNVSLLTLDGVSNTDEAKWYLGKRAAFVYRAPKAVRGTKIRVIWGKIRSTHGMLYHNSGRLGLLTWQGNSGIVRASFKNNLPPRSFGASVRVMMYPSAA